MFKLVVIAALMAVAAAKPTPGLFAYSAPLAAAPLAYSAPIAYSAPLAAAPVAYSAAVAAPLAYSAPVASYSAPVASYSAPVAYSVPAAHSFVSGYNVAVHAEPVEQHGYKIAY